MDLHEQLADHLSSQPFTNTRELAPRLRSAAFAGQSDIRTKPGISVARGGNHVVNIMPLTLTLAKGFEEGFDYLNCGDGYPRTGENIRTTTVGDNCENEVAGQSVF
jgi:hypothetical protein